MSNAAYYWTYTGRGGEPAHAMSTLELALVVGGCLIVELGTIAVAVWWAAREDRRPGQLFRSSSMAALDLALDQLWIAEVRACRERAARATARLVSGRVPVVAVRATRHPGRVGSAQLVFADGTTLALWSKDRSSDERARHLPSDAVLECVPAPDCGCIRFTTNAGDVFVNGDLLLTPPEPWRQHANPNGGSQ